MKNKNESKSKNENIYQDGKKGDDKPPVHVRILESAGTLSPASYCRMSPGTSSSARMLTGAPSLTTLHL